MMLRSLALAALAPVLVFSAAVAPRASKVTTLASDAINGLAPLAAFAAAGYCRANDTAIWKCGANCDSVKDFIPTATGGDGTFSQYWYVGYYGPLDTVVVSHQGTRKKSVLPILVDINIFLEEPDNTIFPGLAKAGVRMHNGFHDAHVQVFPDVLAAVKKTMAQRKTKNILLVGHSLGGALGVFDAIALKFVLPKDTNYRIVTFGQPRLGNQAFASYVDKVFGGSIVRMTNKKDPVPTLPGRFLGFAHYQGEVHIRSKDDAIVICNGSDSEDKDCSIDEVPNIFVSDVNQHKGPYVGQVMKCFDNEGTQVRSLDDDDDAEDYY